MLISMIILGVLTLMIIVGIAKSVLSDLRTNWLIPVIFFVMVIGLNFIPIIRWGGFGFSVGTLLFYLVVFAMFFLFGKLSSQMTAMAIGLILGGLAYAATRLALLGGSNFFGTSNFVYALIIGTLAFFITRNGKYSFISSAIAMLLLNLLVQIGGEISLNYGFDWTMVACGTAFTMHAIIGMITKEMATHSEHNGRRLAHMFEFGRLDD